MGKKKFEIKYNLTRMGFFDPYGLAKKKDISKFKLFTLFIMNFMSFKALGKGIVDLIRVLQGYGITFYKIETDKSSSDPSFIEDTPFYDWFQWANTLVSKIIDWISNNTRPVTNFEMTFLRSLILPFFCASLFIGFTHTAGFIVCLLFMVLTASLIGFEINLFLFTDFDWMAIIVILQILGIVGSMYFASLGRTISFTQFRCCQSLLYFLCALAGFPGSILVMFFITFIGNEFEPQLSGKEKKSNCNYICTRFFTVLWSVIFVFGVVLGVDYFAFDFMNCRGGEIDYFIEKIVFCILCAVFVIYIIVEIVICVIKLKPEQLINHFCTKYIWVAKMLTFPSINAFFLSQPFSVYTDYNSSKIYPFGGIYFFVWVFSVVFPFLFVIVFSVQGLMYRRSQIPYVYRLFLENIDTPTSTQCKIYKNNYSLWPIMEEGAHILFAIAECLGYHEVSLTICLGMAIMDIIFNPYLFTSSTIVDAGTRIAQAIGICVGLYMSADGRGAPNNTIGIVLIVVACLPLILAIVWYCLYEWSIKKRMAIIQHSLVIDLGEDMTSKEEREKFDYDSIEIDDSDLDAIQKMAGKSLKKDEVDKTVEQQDDLAEPVNVFFFDDIPLDIPLINTPKNLNQTAVDNLSDMSLDDFDIENIPNDPTPFPPNPSTDPNNNGSNTNGNNNMGGLDNKLNNLQPLVTDSAEPGDSGTKGNRSKSKTQTPINDQRSQMENILVQSMAIPIEKPYTQFEPTADILPVLEKPPAPRDPSEYQFEKGNGLTSKSYRMHQIIKMAKKLNYRYQDTNDCSVRFDFDLIRDFQDSNAAEKLKEQNDIIAHFIAYILFACIFVSGGFVLMHLITLYLVDTTMVHVFPTSPTANV
ncbi:hypothetical protein TRFO_19229 [Tritrichomonas foetus]|uniref:Uncharacterized protein n=1 Tax=Tritrichomonas foetus TaxID=1144522 RepID=A0A1J4KPK1_9EUKA|nr:hypothetical protein TRFO_19229 [Tritrichomonas foetus]|eukprot:OHT11349.1 hypothetical protein TRFO_19229 [Tritrichomonas foetus]